MLAEFIPSTDLVGQVVRQVSQTGSRRGTILSLNRLYKYHVPATL